MTVTGEDIDLFREQIDLFGGQIDLSGEQTISSGNSRVATDRSSFAGPMVAIDEGTEESFSVAAWKVYIVAEGPLRLGAMRDPASFSQEAKPLLGQRPFTSARLIHGNGR